MNRPFEGGFETTLEIFMFIYWQVSTLTTINMIIILDVPHLSGWGFEPAITRLIFKAHIEVKRLRLRPLSQLRWKDDDLMICIFFVSKECTGSICLAYGMESCQCSQGPDDPPTKACELCCKEPGDDKPCMSSFQVFLNFNFAHFSYLNFSIVIIPCILNFQFCSI